MVSKLRLLQTVFCAALAGFSLLASPVAAQGACAQLPKQLTGKTSNGEKRESGKRPDGSYWAEVQATVDKPITAVLKDMIEHKSTRSRRVSKLNVQTLSSSSQDLRQKATFVIKPMPFMTVEWKEDWSFAALEGSLKNPEKVHAFYEKTEGTNHIRHLCGKIELQKRNPRSTRIALYQEVQASRISQQATLDGLTRTIDNLRASKVP